MVTFCAEMALCLALSGVATALPANQEGKELVTNPTFAGTTGWAVWTPTWEQAKCAVTAVPEGLRMDAPGNDYAVGGASQDIGGIRPGEAYAVEAVCQTAGIPAPVRTVLLRLRWLKDGKQAEPHGVLAKATLSDKGILRFQDIFIAPESVDGVRMFLEMKWPRGGSATWKSVSLRPSEPLPPRKARIGTVYFRPRNSTPEQNRELYCGLVDKAGQLGLDILCLPEMLTLVGTGKTIRECAETIPGPSTERFGRAAKENRLWIVAGIVEQDGDRVYNTAILLNRDGKLAGVYRKVHLPREEWLQGITPGDSYPVFQTDFGTIGIQICYDWFFPEPEAAFALQGAEIIFAPTWGTTFKDEDGKVEGENVFRVRARDNGVYMVPSVFDGSSMVIDPLGRILATNDGKDGVFWAEVDLNARDPLWWVGHWRTIGPLDRMPETYDVLSK